MRFVKGTLPDKPNATREYYGRGDEAEAKARARNLELGFGSARQGSGKTFTTVANYYLSAKNGKIEDKSVDTAQMHIEVHLSPFFGSIDVNRIDESMLDKYVTMRRSQKWRAGGGKGEEKVGVSRSTIKRELGTMQSVLNFAVRRKEILFNPVALYDMPKEDDAVIAPATKAEIAAILKVSPDHLQRFLIIAYYTAVRPGNTELLTLKWEQVDFVGKTIFVVSARKGGLDSRQISIHLDLEQHLLKWYDEDAALKKMPQRIVHYQGRAIKKVDKAWMLAKKRAKVLRRLRLYDIRHASITGMLEAGGDLKAVSMTAGHKNPAMTMRKYQHVSTRLQKVAISGLLTLANTLEDGEAEKV